MKKQKLFSLLLAAACALTCSVIGSLKMYTQEVNAAEGNEGDAVATISESSVDYSVYETYDVLYNADFGLPESWAIKDETFINFTPSAENTTGSFLWKFTYTCTTPSGGMYIYPLVSGGWRGATQIDFGACNFAAGNTYEVEFGVLKEKGASDYTISVVVDGETKINEKRTRAHTDNCTNLGLGDACTDESAHTGLYFYITGGAGTLVSKKPIEYETYDVLYNADFGLPESWAIKDDTFVNFTPSAENTTGSFLWKFTYTCTTPSGGMYIYPLASGSWKGAGHIDLGACGFVEGNTYEVEFGVLKEKGASDYTISVVVDGETKINQKRTRAHNADGCNNPNLGICTDITKHTGLYFYITGGAGTLVSKKPIEYETYDVLYNADFGLPESWATQNETFISFTPSAENTTGSFIWKFSYTCTTAGGINIYPLASGGWRGVAQIDLATCGFVEGNTYEVELRVLKEKGASDYTVSVVVDGETKINEKRTRAHVDNCTNPVLGDDCTDEFAHRGLYFYITGGAGTLVSEKPRNANFDGATLTLGEEITLNYYVQMVDAFADAKMKFTVDGMATIVDGVAGEKQSDGRYKFSLKLAPQFMASNVRAELIFNEEVIANKDGYSIKAYAQNMLNDGNSSAELKQLVSDLLRYGEAAQLYQDFHTENLATAGVANLVVAANEMVSTEKNVFNLEGNADDPAYFMGAGVRFSNDNKIYVKINTTENVTLKINGVEVDVNSTTIYTAGILATGFDDVYTFELSCDGITQTLEYSVNSYIYKIIQNSKNEEMRNLALALYNYGASAKTYKA